MVEMTPKETVDLVISLLYQLKARFFRTAEPLEATPGIREELEAGGTSGSRAKRFVHTRKYLTARHLADHQVYGLLWRKSQKGRRKQGTEC